MQKYIKNADKQLLTGTFLFTILILYAFSFVRFMML